MGDRPTGTMTFLFTDIEGSTRRWQEEPDEMRERLAHHDRVVRSAIEAAGGRVFKHTGDGVVAVFSSAADAVAAAVAAQSGLAGILPVRMGLHTGEAEERDGDFFGSTLNRCARIMAVAHGGQTVCSEATAALVRDRDDLRDLGEHRLRDLSRPERVWQAGGGEFPPLRSLDSYRTNLPVQLTSFVGRDDERNGLVSDLGEHRLVTLTGVGGVGKTRLATQVAAEVAPRFPDGVWLVDLGAVRSEDSVIDAIASALEVRPSSAATLRGALFDVCRRRQQLVVLDNCEHLLEAVGDFAATALSASPQLTILATSREPLCVAGERVVGLRSLGAAEAARLFTDRAAAAGASVDPSAATAVAALCERLDRIPLAIELAAARTRTLSVDEIASRLDQRFRLLTGGRRTAVERHQTLRAAIDWSYQLLNAAERHVLECLSVFASGCALDAAERVCADRDVERDDVLDLVSSLVDKSLLVREAGVEGSRYRMLETVRQFAAERLDDSGSADHARELMSAWLTEFMTAAGAGLCGRDSQVWVDRLETELDNLRLAVAACVDAGRPYVAGDLLRPMRPSRLHGCGVAMPFVSLALSVCDAVDDPDVVGLAGWGALHSGQIARAEQLTRRAVDLAESKGMLSFTVLYVARAIPTYAMDLDAALRLTADYVAAARRAGERFEALQAEEARFYLEFDGDHVSLAEAKALVDEATELGELRLLRHALNIAGRIYMTAGDQATAVAHFVRARDISFHDDDFYAYFTAGLLWVVGGCATPDAAAEGARVIRRLVDVGERLELRASLIISGRLLLGTGRVAAAAQLHGFVHGSGVGPHALYPWEVGAPSPDTLQATHPDDFARGAAMSLDDAVALCLSELDKLAQTVEGTIANAHG